MNAGFLVLTSAIIPVPEALDSGKRMIAGTEDTARPDLFEKNRLIRKLVIGEVFRQNNLGYIDAFRFFLIQPF
jgi:hypothetical protein